MDVTLREFTMADYEQAWALWEKSEGIGLSQADSRENIELFLRRNPGMSWVAVRGGAVVGAVLCGHDGRRGFLHHLAVSPAERRAGLGRRLVETSLGALHAAGMRKCHIFVMSDNEEGRRFWTRIGWELRTTLVVMSHDVPA
jgi:N-acetylglutamate synthase